MGAGKSAEPPPARHVRARRESNALATGGCDRLDYQFGVGYVPYPRSAQVAGLSQSAHWLTA